MKQFCANSFYLGVKELRSLFSDPIMVFLIIYIFSFAIIAVANGAKMDVEHSSIAVVDEDKSHLSRQLMTSFIPPYFKVAQEIAAEQIDKVMNHNKFVFILDIPPNFEKDLLAGRHPQLQLNVDATAMSQAGNGASYIQHIIVQEINTFLQGKYVETISPLQLVVNAEFNPNLNSLWFTSVMQIMNNITILSMILAGAALIREREHGTVEHLLVMPVTPAEIMFSKIWANAFVIIIAAVLSLLIVIEKILNVPISGSIPLYIFGSILYMFSVTALGLLLATVTRSMAQFGLLLLPVLVIMELLSGSTTPIESMPRPLQIIMQLVPSTHYVAFSQAVLYRGAGLDIVWGNVLSMALMSVLLFGLTLLRFRRAILQM